MQHDASPRIHAQDCRCMRCAPRSRRSAQLLDLVTSWGLTALVAGILNGAALALFITIANH